MKIQLTHVRINITSNLIFSILKTLLLWFRAKATASFICTYTKIENMNSIHFVHKSRSLISSVEHLQPLANGSDSGYAGDPDFSSAVSQTARYRTELSAISESIGWLQATTYKCQIPSICVCAIECHEVKVTVFSVDSKTKIHWSLYPSRVFSSIYTDTDERFSSVCQAQTF